MVADTLLHFRIALPHSNENENAISNSLSNFSDPHLGSILLRNWKKCYLWIMSKIWLVLQTQNSTWTVSKFSSLFPNWNTPCFRPNTLSSRVICFFLMISVERVPLNALVRTNDYCCTLNICFSKDRQRDSEPWVFVAIDCNERCLNNLKEKSQNK